MNYSSTIVKNPDTGYFTGQLFREGVPVESTAPQRSFTNAKRLLNKRIEQFNILHATKIPPCEMKEKNAVEHFPISRVGGTVKQPMMEKVVEKGINDFMELGEKLHQYHQQANATQSIQSVKVKTEPKTKPAQPKKENTMTPKVNHHTTQPQPTPTRITGVLWNEESDEITIITGKRRIKLTLDAIEKAMIIQKGILNLAQKLGA